MRGIYEGPVNFYDLGGMATRIEALAHACELCLDHAAIPYPPDGNPEIIAARKALVATISATRLAAFDMGKMIEEISPQWMELERLAERESAPEATTGESGNTGKIDNKPKG